jgi:hypothetical protein
LLRIEPRASFVLGNPSWAQVTLLPQLPM